MIPYEKLKPIPKKIFNRELDRNEVINRVLIKYNAADLEKANMIGRFYIPETLQKTGEYSIEFGTVKALSGKNSTLEVGNEIASSYSLIMIERSKNDKSIYHDDYLGADEFGNEYAIPPITHYNVFAKFVGDKIFPLEGQVFCEIPVHNTPDKIGKIWIPETAKKTVTDKKCYTTKVLFIHKNDSKKLGIKVGDEIVCGKNSDIPITLRDNKYIRVPSSMIYGVMVKNKNK